MKTITKTTFLSGAVLALITTLPTLTTAADIDPTVAARQMIMKTLKDGMGPLGGMAKGAVAFDADAAQIALQSIIEASAKAVTAFETNATDPKSEALPAIWENWDDFVAKSEDLDFALEAWDVSSLESLQAGMGYVGAACGACHKTYRIKK